MNSKSSTKQTKKMTTKDLLEKRDDVTGYFHNVTTIKESKTKFKYFNFDIQTENDLIKGVCFELTLHKDIVKKCEIQRPVNNGHYSVKASLQHKQTNTLVPKL